MNLGPRQVGAIVKMFDEGLPIPYIARYRKEQTGGAEEAILSAIRARVTAMAQFDEQKQAAIDEIHSLGMTDSSIAEAIASAEDSYELADLTAFYQLNLAVGDDTQTVINRYASQMLENQPGDLDFKTLANQLLAANIEFEPVHINEPAAIEEFGIAAFDSNRKNAIISFLYAVARIIGSTPKARRLVRQRYQRQATVATTIIDPALADAPESAPYRQLLDHSELLRLCTPQRYLLMCRGRNEGILNMHIDISGGDSGAAEDLKNRLVRMFVRSTLSDDMSMLVRYAVELAYAHHLRPEIRDEVTDAAQRKSEVAAIEQMSENLREKLLAPPLAPLRRVMGIYPESSDVIHVVCLEPGPEFSDGAVMALATLRPVSDPYGSSEHLGFLLERNMIEAVALAEMPAARGVEIVIRNLQLPRPPEMHYISARMCEIVADSELEANPSLAASSDAIYSRSVAAGRLLLDPLAQLVKVIPELVVDPSLHPEAVDQKALRQALVDTVRSCVCSVGVDPNTASYEMLRYVPGITQKLADYIFEFRQNAIFNTRQDLLEVKRMGTKAFNLCAPFFRLPESPNPLDNTFIHPERYDDIERIASDMGVTVDQLSHSSQVQNVLAQTIPTYANRKLNAATLKFIVESLRLGGNDPRVQAATQRGNYGAGMQSEGPIRPQRVASSGQQTGQTTIDPEFLSTLHIGQVLEGRVTHLAPYGAFVNIGHNTSGLLHVSQMSDDFISSPNELVSPGQTLKVKILDIDPRLLRVALTLKGIIHE